MTNPGNFKKYETRTFNLPDVKLAVMGSASSYYPFCPETLNY